MFEEIAQVIFGPIGAVVAIVVLVAKAVGRPEYQKVRNNEAELVLTRNAASSSGKEPSDIVLGTSRAKPSKLVATKMRSRSPRSRSASKDAALAQISKAKSTTSARAKKSKSKTISSRKKRKAAA